MDRLDTSRCTRLMTTTRTLVVVSHHRPDSRTAHVAELVAERLRAAEHEIDVLDLRSEGFDPRMTVEDEPDWTDRDKAYSVQVQQHMERILAADLLVVVFPIYWQSTPALLKGWIDRVWNYGFAYGRSDPRLAGKRVLWVGLAGATAEDPIVAPMADLLEAQLSEGIAYYCGFAKSAVAVLPDAEDQPQSVDELGNLIVGEAPAGEELASQHRAFDRRVLAAVDEFAA